MVETVQKIIGKIVPNRYSNNGQELLSKYKEISKIPANEVNPSELTAHRLVYDSANQNLEPIYFFLLDLMQDLDLSPKKVLDTFASSPGSGHFAEMGQRATIMQQQATKLLGDINVVLKSVLNIIYDLKEFKIRLGTYEDLKDPGKKEAAILALKQIWLDKVDIAKGNTSVKAMAFGQVGFQTLLDAFLIARDAKHAETLDLNDRVKRIVASRVNEFNDWLSISEKELRKRFNLEQTYLKSQVNSLKLYSKWVKPYLKVAEDLSNTESKSAALVKSFSTVIMNLTLFGRKKISVKDAILEGRLPKEVAKMKIKDYYIGIILDFTFRSIPQKVSQQGHYAFGGRAEIIFSSYALGADEIAMVDSELEKSDVNDALSLIEGITSESLEELKADLEEFTKEEKKEEKKDWGKNPFLALLGFYNESKEKKEEKKPKKKEEKKISPENYIEKNHIRPLTEEKANEMLFTLFNTYKKANGLQTYD